MLNLHARSIECRFQVVALPPDKPPICVGAVRSFWVAAMVAVRVADRQPLDAPIPVEIEDTRAAVGGVCRWRVTKESRTPKAIKRRVIPVNRAAVAAMDMDANRKGGA